MLYRCFVRCIKQSFICRTEIQYIEYYPRPSQLTSALAIDPEQAWMNKVVTALAPAAPVGAPPEVGATLQRMRLARGLTLEDLSRIAGVSKSMLSQIEREKANPTIAITWRLANALGVQIGELLSSEVRSSDMIRVVDAHEIPTLPGAHAGYSLRILGPMDLAGKYEWYELTLAPGGELASQPTIRAPASILPC
jgi:transcriptional regulator with XRE-family HTH domain